MRASGGLEFELTIFTCVSGGAAATCLFSTQMKIHVAIVSVPKVPFEDGVAAVLPYRYTRRSSELQREEKASTSSPHGFASRSRCRPRTTIVHIDSTCMINGPFHPYGNYSQGRSGRIPYRTVPVGSLATAPHQVLAAR